MRNSGRGIASRLLVLLLCLTLTGAVAACGKSSSSSSAAAPTATGSASAGSSASAGPASCSQVGTRRIPKARVLGDLAISAGAFHRYIYKPIRSGTFSSQSAPRKALTLAKGAVAAAAIYHFMGNAVDNARSDPTLCRYVPTMDQVRNQLNLLSGSLRRGDTSQLTGTENGFSQLARQTGFTPDDNATVPGAG
jgi:hypothetical protein